MESEKDYCPKKDQCPLFQGDMLESEKAHEIYMNIFCKAGEAGRMQCKRFLLTLKNIKPTIDIMPDDSRSIDELVEYLKP